MRIYTYKVSGKAPFPVDMLRYDQAFPRHEDQSHLITSEFDPFVAPPTGAVMTVELGGLRPPTFGRWESFGWSADFDSITWVKA